MVRNLFLCRQWLWLVVLTFTLGLQAQQAAPAASVSSGAGIVDVPVSQSAPTRVLSFSGVLPEQPDGAVAATFSIYPEQQSTNSMWTETQTVEVTGGRYGALLGSTAPSGLPPEIFASDQAHWLGVQVNGVEKRYLLVSVPYALKAISADQLGGLPASEYATVQQLRSILQASGPRTNSTAARKPHSEAASITPDASMNPPQPATDFTDNNASEVLLVTQQGTGFAIHAISSGDAALFAENSNTAAGATALRALASATSGTTIGILGQAASPAGIAGVFDNTGGGQIISLRSNGTEVASVDQAGNLRAQSFAGSGVGLFNIPNLATTATSANTPNAIVARDASGNFSAGQITANIFAGNGAGLFNIPNLATSATSANTPNAIVARDASGNLSAGQITANIFAGNGAGLFNIPNLATTATSANTSNAIVARDASGSFSAGQITANIFAGNGVGLFNIPNFATTATSNNTANAIVARDANGNFSAGQITANGLNVVQLTALGTTDFSTAQKTSPVRAVLSANTPTSCTASRELLIKTDGIPGQQLFICNSSGNGYVLVGDGVASGVTSVTAGDSSITIGGTSLAPTISVANGGITSSKLAPNAVTFLNIADGSLPPAKVAGIAATLGNNAFTGAQTMPQLNVQGAVTASGPTTLGGPTTVTTATGTALTVSGGDINSPALNAVNKATDGIAVQGNVSGDFGSAIQGTVSGNYDVAGTFTNSTNTGSILSGRIGFASEVFNVDTLGNEYVYGGHTLQYTNSSTGTIPFSLAKLDANGDAIHTSAGDTSGAIGIVTSLAGTSGPVFVAYTGAVWCLFDNPVTIGDYVQISATQAGRCTDSGPAYPASGQVIGRVLQPGRPGWGWILLFGPEEHGQAGGTVMAINTGAGLVGGPITNSGTISIANGGVTNFMLQNKSVTVTPGAGLSGGGTVPLGGTVTLNNAGVLSFNGRTGGVSPASGDYAFAQLSGSILPSQLPTNIVYNDQSNTFSADQTINGKLTTSTLATGAIAGTSVSIVGSTSATTSVVSVNDSAPASGSGAAISAYSRNNPAGFFVGDGSTIFTAASSTHNIFSVSNAGANVAGTMTASAFSGDGSALSNVNATQLGGFAAADLATNTALNSESSARQSGDNALQASITAETAARQSGEATLQAGIGAETTARQSDIASVQTSINNVSAADAKLAASNTFTAGTQDLSGAGATLPVHAVLSTQVPASCVASKELLIETDAPGGQQLFICNSSGNGWNLVGDGAAGGVTSFNGRNGSVTPASGDYSFNQVAGSVAASQLPAFSGDVTTAAGSTTMTLASTGVAAGTFTKITVDAKGRATSGAQAAFSDLAGAASATQLPATVVYNNQANTFTGSQTVNGAVNAGSFSGNGAGLSNVNAVALNGVASTSFAQLAAANTFTAKQTLPAATTSSASLNVPVGVAPSAPAAGDVWNTGNVIQYSDSASSTRSLVSTPQGGGLQMLKLTASITPSSVALSTCSEQSFTVSGINSGDVLLVVQQPSTSSPGTSIAIGGWRVPAANTVAIQFCNVSKGSSHTPVGGTYTFALMR